MEESESMNRSEYKEALGQIDKNTRKCILHIEDLINEKFKIALQVKQPKIPKIDFSKFDMKYDSLQKQIDGIRVKVNEAHDHAQNHEHYEIYMKSIINKAEMILDQLQGHFKELYESGYYSEGTKRKIRSEGLIRIEKE